MLTWRSTWRRSDVILPKRDDRDTFVSGHAAHRIQSSKHRSVIALQVAAEAADRAMATASHTTVKPTPWRMAELAPGLANVGQVDSLEAPPAAFPLGKEVSAGRRRSEAAQALPADDTYHPGWESGGWGCHVPSDPRVRPESSISIQPALDQRQHRPWIPRPLHAGTHALLAADLARSRPISCVGPPRRGIEGDSKYPMTSQCDPSSGPNLGQIGPSAAA